MSQTLKRTLFIISMMIAMFALPAVTANANTKANEYDFNAEFAKVDVPRNMVATPQSNADNDYARRVVEPNITYANVQRTSLDTTIADFNTEYDLNKDGPTAVYRRPRCVGELTALDSSAKAMQRPPERAQRTLSTSMFRFIAPLTTTIAKRPTNLPVHRPTIVDLR